MQAPTLTDGEHPDAITLRPLASSDLDACLELGGDAEVQRWSTLPTPFRAADAATFLAESKAAWDDASRWTWAVQAMDDDAARFAGTVRLRPNGSGAAELSYALLPWARGRAVASRAVRLALSWALSHASDGGGLVVVHWRALVGNWPARRVAWACGFRIEGTVRGSCAQRGVQYDGWIGSVVRGDELAPAHPWLDVPTLTADRVRLRQWRADDVPRVAQACSDARTQQWLPGLPSPYTLADAQWYVGSREEESAAGAGICWCVADLETDACLGSISLMKRGGPMPEREIGYWAHPDARSRGVMSQAAELVVEYALTPVADGGLGVNRVMLRAATENTASRAVAERAGLQHFGTAHRFDQLRDGSWKDLELYEALAADA